MDADKISLLVHDLRVNSLSNVTSESGADGRWVAALASEIHSPTTDAAPCRVLCHVYCQPCCKLLYVECRATTC